MHTPLDPYADAAVRFRKQLGMTRGDQRLGRDVSTSTILCGNCKKGKTTVSQVCSLIIYDIVTYM